MKKPIRAILRNQQGHGSLLQGKRRGHLTGSQTNAIVLRMKSSLESLLVDENQLHDDLLTSLLESRLWLTSSGQLVFKNSSPPISARLKALIGVLGAMALYRLEKRFNNAVSPKELGQLTGLPGGTLRPTLRDLTRDGFLRATDGLYEVPAHAIESVRKALSV